MAHGAAMPRGPAAAYAAGTFDEARLHMVEAKLEEAARYEEACLRSQRAAHSQAASGPVEPLSRPGIC